MQKGINWNQIKLPIMGENYYLALFSKETWEEFLKNKSLVYGTTKNKITRMKNIEAGSYLICYISKISCFVGVLQTNSKAYYDEEKIWENDTFPVRVKVKTIHKLELDQGIFAKELKNDLQIFSRLKNPKRWGGFFHNSLNKIPCDDAEKIIQKIIEKEKR